MLNFKLNFRYAVDGRVKCDGVLQRSVCSISLADSCNEVVIAGSLADSHVASNTSVQSRSGALQRNVSRSVACKCRVLC